MGTHNDGRAARRHLREERFGLKRRYDLALAKTPYDIAKDIVAFASAAGGTVVVGADEIAGRVSGATRRRKSGGARPRDRGEPFRPCLPWPLYQEKVLTLSREDGARVLPGTSNASSVLDLLRVNVGPDVRGPIGVRPKNDKGNPIQNAYSFPVRVGEQTDWLRPDQLAMWMNSHERRVAVLLRKALGSSVRAHYRRGSNQQMSYTRDLVLQDLDEGQSQMTLRDPTRSDVLANIPLAFVVAVWRDAGDSRWEIAVNGSIFSIGDNGGASPRFIPYLGGA